MLQSMTGYANKELEINGETMKLNLSLLTVNIATYI